MQIQIGLENNNEGRSVAWALDYPGCYAIGEDGKEAVFNMSLAIPQYIAWMEKNTPDPWFNPSDIDIRLVEIFEDYQIDHAFNTVNNGGNWVKAFFKHDWKPLTTEEIDHAMQILTWTRRDFLAVIDKLTDRQLELKFPDERWSLKDIIGHVGRAEWWLMDRIGRAHDISLLSDNPFQRIVEERGNFITILPDLIDLKQVVGKDGEIWSPRKVLRRVCWHERDHTQHIQKLVLKDTGK